MLEAMELSQSKKDKRCMAIKQWINQKHRLLYVNMILWHNWQGSLLKWQFIKSIAVWLDAEFSPAHPLHYPTAFIHNTLFLQPDLCIMELWGQY